MKSTILTMLLLCFLLPLFAQQRINGRIVSAKNNDPLSFVTIKIKDTENEISTDSKGEFSYSSTRTPIVLILKAIGYKTKEIIVSSTKAERLEIKMEEDIGQLNEVTVVSTGYQTLPKERATGSFVHIDNELLNRRVSTNILNRLEDVTPGLIFNRGKTDQGSIRIRGQNTIYGNANPLIVIDNFPYEGDISNINPNDVESMTVLKDAAAASIWGARAGNGVIVITSKKGKLNQQPRITFNSNLTVSDKPDIFYQPRMSTTDFIEIEKKLFSQGYYSVFETQISNPALTPIVELLITKRTNPSLGSQIDAQIEALKAQDVRNDFKKHFFQNGVNQQYNINVNGGGEKHNYFISAGYDRNKDNLVNNGFNRVTLNVGNSFSLLKDKLEATANIYYTQGITTNNNSGINTIGLYSGNGSSLYPYAKLADDRGNPLSITQDYRASFVEQARSAGLLDWTYRPLEEIRIGDNSNNSKDYRINSILKYKILPSLSIDALYQYGNNMTNSKNLRSQDSYFTRDMINRYTQVSATGLLSYPVPLGSIVNLANREFTSHNFRGQLNYNNNWDAKHELNAIAGYELRDYRTTGNNNRIYGYDDEHAITSKVDYLGTYEQYYFKGVGSTIPFSDASSNLTDRYISYYANGAYSYLNRYTISASARIDRSNLFGVNTNQKGVPLYSAGFAWDISKENFYRLNELLPYIKVRATYGYNGNINKSLSAYTTARYRSGNAINRPFAEIINPPNPDLIWERVKIINFGIDFATSKSRISGSVEPYIKYGKNLIGDIALAPSSGVTTFRGNTANTKGKGIDIVLNSQNLTGPFKWNTNFIFSYVNDKVVDYDLKEAAINYTNYAEWEIHPLSGNPFYSLYSYKFMGLDPNTGDPQGYLKGEVSKNYTQILAEATPDNLVFHGSARPTTFGSLRNTISWKNFSLSANISYRLGYYFRKTGIFYDNILVGQGYLMGNYDKRWKKSGDELTTTIPSIATGINANRDSFYNYSEATVEKGDHIRFQDINISYNITKSQFPSLPFNNINIYMYANNLGLIWKSSQSNLDPDYSNADFVVPRSLSFGLKVGF